MERSFIPVARTCTSPVLHYMLLTFRHSDELLCRLIEPTVKTLSKMNMLDPSNKSFKYDLAEVFLFLLVQFPSSETRMQPLLKLISVSFFRLPVNHVKRDIFHLKYLSPFQ